MCEIQTNAQFLENCPDWCLKKEYVWGNCTYSYRTFVKLVCSEVRLTVMGGSSFVCP
jgi:hypothetical protein